MIGYYPNKVIVGARYSGGVNYEEDPEKQTAATEENYDNIWYNK